MNVKLIWSATSEWLGIAVRQGLLIDWKDPWDRQQIMEAARMAAEDYPEGGIDPEDQDLDAAFVVPRECDTKLHPGDIVLWSWSRPRGDVYFFRPHFMDASVQAIEKNIAAPNN